MFEFSSGFASTNSKEWGRRPEQWWYDHLMAHPLMVFTLGPGPLLLKGVRQTFRHGGQVVFGISSHTMKVAPRSERGHHIELQTLGPGDLRTDGGRQSRLGARPQLLPRVSPEAVGHIPEA